MSKKTIEFSAKLSTTQFDQQIQQLQQKLKASQGDFSRNVLSSEVQQRMSKAGLSTGVSPIQAELQQKQSLREMDRFIKEQYRQANQLNKAIDDRAKNMERLRKMEKEALDDEKKRLEIQKQMTENERQRSNLERQHAQQMSTVKQALDQRSGLAAGIQNPQGLDRLSRAYQGGGLGGAARAGYRMMGGGVGMALGGLGFAAQAIQMADPVIRSIGAQNLNYTMAQGSTIGGLSHTGSVYNNQLATQMYFQPERQKALNTALEKMQYTKFADNLSPYGTLAGNAAKGAAMGATGGTLFGGIGAVPGALVGGGLGALKGGYDIMSDERSRLALGSHVESLWGGNHFGKKLEARQLSEMMSDFNQAIEAEKQKDPVKKMAEERYQQTRERNLQYQRATGLSNEGFYGGGGLLSRGFREGFSEEETLGMSGSIMGAGGSTRSARYNNVLGNQMAKRMDMTNASSILGTISGRVGGNVETENATIKVLAEGMRLGLDKSEFAAEQRKFAEMTANAIASSGAYTEAGAAQASTNFAGFNAGTTMGAMQGMESAKGFYDSATSQTGNPRGAIKAAKMMSDGVLGKLSMDSMKNLSEMSSSELTVDSPFVKNAAREAGVSPEDIVKRMGGIQSDSLIIRGGAEKIRGDLQSKYKKMKAEGRSEQEINEAMRNDPQMNQMLTAIGTEDSSFKGIGNEGMYSIGMKAIRGESGDLTKEIKDVQDKLNKGGSTGRVEDTSLEAVAKQQEIVNNKFMEMKDSMGAAAESAKQMTEAALNMHMRLAEALTKGDTLTPEQLKSIINPEKPKVGVTK